MHMHVGCVLVFDGVAPGVAELTELIRSRLDLVPRYRRSALAVPLRQGRAAWVDDPNATYVPLPVGIEDPRRRHAEIGRTLDGLRASGRALAAETLVELDGFAPATILSQAARLQARQRGFNLSVTNIPGPQRPRYLLGRELRAIYPAVPLARKQALSVAVIGYAGRLCFGLLADHDALADLELLAGLLEEALAELPKGARAEGRSAGQ